MGTLNPDLLDANSRTALSRAAEVMRGQAKPMLMPEMLLLALIRMPQSTAERALDRLAQTRGFKLKEVELELENQLKTRVGRSANFTFMTDNNTPVTLSDETLIAIDEARSIAMAAGEVYIGTEHLLGALAQPGVSTAGALQRRGVTPAAIAELVNNGVVSKRTVVQDWIKQARNGLLAPLYMRDGLLRELCSLLSLSRDRHVILLANDGSGRRSLVQSLALLSVGGWGQGIGPTPPKLQSIIEVSDVAWLDNPQMALQAGLRQAENGVLFIDNIHRFFAREYRQDSVTKALQKVFLAEEGNAIIIGTTTEAEYTDKLRGNLSISEHAHVLRVPPATVDECQKMLALVKTGIEREYELTIDPSATKAAAVLASRFIGDQPLPGSAVRVLHRACSMIKVAGNNVGEGQTATSKIVNQDVVALAISQMTGVPTNKLGQDERSKFAGMDQALQQRVIGQDDAVRAVSRAVKVARVGLKDSKRPIGSFLFLGPSGVGKTELARALADFLFGSDDAMIAIDMSEYQKDDTINRLIGSPPGYVGYESGGQLTERILKSPYAVVLFDEVEKAHPRILDILLQVLEEGRLTDGQGRVANFSETVILLTSNLGANYLIEGSKKEDAVAWEVATDLAMTDVRSFFRPEFLNRLDEIVMFKPLSPAALTKVLDLMILKEIKTAKERGIGLEITPAARVWMLAQNEHPEWGARPLRRILQRSVRDQLADYLLSLDQPPSRVVVDAAEGKLVFTN